MSSNETFYEYDSDHMYANKSLNSPNAGGDSSMSGSGKQTVSTTNFDQRIFELGGGDSENDTDKNSSSTFDMA